MIIQIATLICIALLLGISTSVGIGGTNLIIILLNIGFDSDLKTCIVLTYIFLMGGGLAATVIGARKFNEKGKRCIDYDLVLLTLPMVTSGTIFGTIVNHFLSESVITAMFSILMFYLLKTTYSQLKQISPEDVKSDLSIKSPLKEQLLAPKSDLQAKYTLEEVMKEQQQLVPWSKLKIVFQITVYTAVLVLFRGGLHFDSIIGLQQCNIGSWICVILHFILSYLYCKSIAMKKFQADMQKESLGYIFEDPKEKMSYEKMRQAMFNGFLAGTLSSCLAVSAGLVLIPLWLRAGIDRTIVINSTAPLIFFGATISFFISCLLGFYDSLLQIVLFFVISFIGSYSIKNWVMRMEEKHNFRTIQYVILIFLISLSLLTFLPMQYHNYLKDPEAFNSFSNFC